MQAALVAGALRTSLGCSVEDVLARCLDGTSFERAVVVHPCATYRCVLRAPFQGQPAPSRHRRFLRRMALLAVEAGTEAARLAAVTPGERLGVFVATATLRASWEELMPALAAQDGQASPWNGGLSRLHPFWMLQYLSNNAQALLATDLGALGEGVTFGGATGAAQAIAAATRALHAGVLDQAVVVAYDSLLEPETLVALGEAGALATAPNVETLAAPYSRTAAGFVPGEAAAAIVLEAPDRAGHRALALVQAASGADGSAGEPESATIRKLLSSLPSGVGMIDGAARAIPELDLAERGAAAAVLGRDVLLGATASAMGDAGVAKPVIQTVVLAECLRRGVFPPIAGLRETPPGPLQPVSEPAYSSTRCAMGITTGAPGLVAAVRVALP